MNGSLQISRRSCSTTEEADEPLITSDEHLKVMDKEARQNEVSRLKKIPVMEEASEEDVHNSGGYIISTKFVVCWKHRMEQGGCQIGGKTVQEQRGLRANVRAHINACGAKTPHPPDAECL